MTTNFVTPPDFVDDPNHTVLLIDADPVDAETLAHLCAGHDEAFNIYLYKADMHQLSWLDIAVLKADVILINSEENNISPIKDKIATLSKSFHYGPKHFLNNTRTIANVYEYFIKRSNERKSQTSNTL